ncbi:PREDICTED: mitochondrial coenzyme A transporter SLC25A42 [Ceratosolen solmsi marchali]|uniref:Mitochondrial coenzyme A transporter SLC25A42 n=1 Tax=Ceratosolen solmsi marchali TaxID=326594 RepID=A0AAJ6YJ77_9HYME|nr:PREDICTED: mitochondrial coenzyme A transporter SLC25A42 [Ceratosolen solmsi marchali]
MSNSMKPVSTQSGTIKSNNDEMEKIPSSSPKRSDTLTNSQRIWTSLAAGAIAGGAAKTSIAPLDRTKINFQTSQQPFSTKAVLDFLIKSYQKDGLLSLWRGNSATMVRIVPYAAIQFTAYEQWKRILKVDETDVGDERRFIAGAIAGLISQAMTYPLDLARAQMAVTQKDEYKTLRQVFTQIYKKDGLVAFYRGFTPTILGVVPYAGCSFFFYDTLKNILTIYTVNSPALSAMTGLMSGAIAGMIGQASSYPLDIVRRRMQTSAVKNQQSLGIIKMTMKIYGEDGIMSFYKGLSMNWVKGPIAVGISFATYDIMKDFLRKIFC